MCPSVIVCPCNSFPGMKVVKALDRDGRKSGSPQNLLVPWQAARELCGCSVAGGGCGVRAGGRRPCRSARTHRAFGRCGEPCAPLDLASGRSSCRSEGTRRVASRDDSSAIKHRMNKDLRRECAVRNTFMD